MEKVREIVNLALAERAKVGIKVRQPLAGLKIKTLPKARTLFPRDRSEINKKRFKINKFVSVAEAAKINYPAPVGAGYPLRGKFVSAAKAAKIDKELLELIKEEVNVKKILFDAKIKEGIKLDTKITKELKEEGLIREVIRNLQEMRKQAGLKPKDKILILYSGSSEINKIISKNKKFVTEQTLAKNLSLRGDSKEKLETEKEIEIEGVKLWLGIKKIH